MSKQFWANLALSIVLGALAIFAVTKFSSALTPKGLLVVEPEPSEEASRLLPQVILTNFQIGESLDRVVEADFYVQNNSDKDIKNIGVMCEFVDEQGGFVDRKRWILAETVSAGQSARLSQTTRQFVNTRASALNCRIADFQLVKEPFFTLDRIAEAGHQGASESGYGKAEPAGH